MSKTCNCCGKVYDSVPENAKFCHDAIVSGWYFNCVCKSTLVIPYGQDLKKALEDFRAVHASGQGSPKKESA